MAPNPFSAALHRALGNTGRDVAGFVEDWGTLEALVIDIYRAGSATPDQAAALAGVRGRLRSAYPGVKSDLTRHWQGLIAGGETITADPFERLLAVPDAAGFEANWPAMQTLPAAREALNRMLLAMGEAAAR